MMDCERFLKLSSEYNGSVCIFGAGSYGKTWCYELLKDAGFNIECYVDNYKAGGECNGLSILSTEYIRDHKDLFVFISTCGEIELMMVDQLNRMGVGNYYHFTSGYAPADFAQYLDELQDDNLKNSFPSIMDDESYLKIYYRYRTGGGLNLKRPKSFNEKLQWLKLYDRNPLYTKLSDKYDVKKYVTSVIGEGHVIPTLFVGESADELDISRLPKQFVLKCTHDSGVIICRDKRHFDLCEAMNELTLRLRTNYFWKGREWCYKDIVPRIICEPYIVDESGYELKDYKVFCFDGEPRLIQVDFDRFKEHKRNLYTIDWEMMDGEIEFPSDRDCCLQRPKKLREMLDFARKLSRGIPHVRVDFYICNNDIYVGEMTFYHGNGCEDFRPASLGIELGGYIDLNKAWIYKND